MQRADLNDMVIFAAVVEAGSFTQAANRLGQPKSTLSRRVARLEERLKVRLLHRTTRALHLTDIGETYYRYCQRISNDALEAEQIIHEISAEPTGLLALTAPMNLSGALSRLVAQFMRRYPAVTIQVVYTDSMVDLVSEGVDLAFRFGNLKDSSFVSRRLGADVGVTCASPDYLACAPKLDRPEDLSQHRCISYNPPHMGSKWEMYSSTGKVTVSVTPALSVNNLDAIHGAAINGVGIAMLPARLCKESFDTGKLVPVLTDWSYSPVHLNLVYPTRRQLSAKVRAFIDFTVEKIDENGLVHFLGQ